jgi:polyhydroxyalkanoate synthesis repressor PhaR
LHNFFCNCVKSFLTAKPAGPKLNQFQAANDGAISGEQYPMAKNNSDESRTLEIRKYQNWRYYDCTRSRHLSLQQIHKLIIEGYNIRVLDAKTNEDITSKILPEYEPVKLHLFSSELLTCAIRVNDRLLKDFVDVYFRQAFEAFCGSQKQVDQMLRQAHHLTSILPAAASSAANLLPSWMPLSAVLPSAPTPASGSNEEPGSAGVQNEIATLREEVSKLKTQLKLRGSWPRRKQKR